MNKRKLLAAILVYIAAIAVCVVAIYIIPSLKGILDKTYVTEIGSLDITDKVSAYIVRDETVYVAGRDSAVNRLADADKLVKAGTRVVELTKTGEEDGGSGSASVSRRFVSIMKTLGEDIVSTNGGYCKDAGYVSYYIDGAEASLSTDRLADLKMDDYKALTGLKPVETPDRKCAKGEPVFKIVRNSKWYLVFYLDNEAAAKYVEGSYVYLTVGDDKIRVQVEEVARGSETSRITLKCKSFFDGFLEKRTLDTVVTVASAEGLMLDDSSIVVTSEDQKGVFVKNKLGKHVFTPIAVKADDGEKSVAYSDIYVDADGNFVNTLKVYDEIVAQPTEEDLKSVKAVMMLDKQQDAEDNAAEESGTENASEDDAAADDAAENAAE